MNKTIMKKKRYIGILYGLVALFLIGIEPIIINSRPNMIDAYLFAAMTCIIQAIFFFPFHLIKIY